MTTGLRILFRERGPPRDRDQTLAQAQHSASPPPSSTPSKVQVINAPLYRSVSADSHVAARQQPASKPQQTWRQRLFSGTRRNEALRKVNTTPNQPPATVPFDAVKNSSRIVKLPSSPTTAHSLEAGIISDRSSLPRPPTLPDAQTAKSSPLGESSSSTITSEVLEHRLSKVLRAEDLRMAKSAQPVRAVRAPGLTSLQRVGARRLSDARAPRLGAPRLDEMFDNSAPSRTQVNADHAKAELTPTRSPSPAPLASTSVDPELLAQELCRLELERQARRLDMHRRRHSHQVPSDHYNLERIYRAQEMTQLAHPQHPRRSSLDSTPSILAPASPSSSLSSPVDLTTPWEGYAPVHAASLETVHEEERRLIVDTPYHTSSPSPRSTPTPTPLDFGSLGPPTERPASSNPTAVPLHEDPSPPPQHYPVRSRSPISEHTALSDDGDDLGYDSDATVRRIESWRGTVLKASKKAQTYAPSAAGTEPSTFELSRGVARRAAAQEDAENATEGSVLTSVSRAKPRRTASSTPMFARTDPSESITSIMAAPKKTQSASPLPFGTTHKSHCKGSSFIFDHYFGDNATQ